LWSYRQKILVHWDTSGAERKNLKISVWQQSNFSSYPFITQDVCNLI
jgi:hypothetical protein